MAGAVPVNVAIAPGRGKRFSGPARREFPEGRENFFRRPA
jgi:hypothetical protein